MRFSGLLRYFTGLSLALMLAVSQAAEDPLAKARELINAGKAQQAYELLEPLEDDRAGDPDFDYIFGVAALDSGKKTRAVFALERVLAVNPEHKQARAEIARAYFELNEVKTAQKEFESLKGQGVPADVQATMDKYLTAIDQALAGQKTRVTGYFEGTVGYDSNINSATSNSQVAIPSLGGLLFTLSNTGIEAGSMSLRLGAGVNLTHAFAERYRFLAGARANTKDVGGEFDTRSAAIYTGIAHQYDSKNSFSAVAQVEAFQLDLDPYRNTVGATLQWTHKLDTQSQFSLYYQGADIHYVSQEIRDANRHAFGGGYTRALTGKRAPIIFAGLYGGRENEEASNVKHLGHTFIGGRIGGQIKVTSRINAYGNVAVEDRSYGGTEPLFLTSRDDTRVSVTAGLDYRLADKWNLKPEVSYTENDSNIILNDYDRYAIGVTLRRSLP